MNDPIIIHICDPTDQDIWDINDWIEENTKHGYNTRLIDGDDTSMLYEVEFNDEHDAILFSLTWS